MKNFWQEIEKPILMLSPMAGYTDCAFRIICKKQGANLLMTELVSADAIAHFAEKSKTKNNPTLKLMQFQEEEMPIVVQLFGKNPENFAKAAIWIEKNLSPAGIDINFGCPAKKVVRSDHGVALLKNPKLAVEIAKAAVGATKLPVSVKTRLGWENDDEILEFGPKLISAGISALIIHGRTYKDGFSGEARWENIYKLKSEIRSANRRTKSEVKVIGNGDIKSYSGIKEKLKNLDGVAIGRGTIGNPFIFNSEFEKLEASSRHLRLDRGSITDKELLVDPRLRGNDKKEADIEKKILEIKKKAALEHAKLAFEFFGDRGIIELRKHLLWYFKGYPQAKELRKKFVAVKSVEDVEKVLVGGVIDKSICIC